MKALHDENHLGSDHVVESRYGDGVLEADRPFAVGLAMGGLRAERVVEQNAVGSSAGTRASDADGGHVAVRRVLIVVLRVLIFAERPGSGVTLTVPLALEQRPFLKRKAQTEKDPVYFPDQMRDRMNVSLFHSRQYTP